MIIQLEGATTQDVEAARRSLGTLARSWGHGISETAPTARTAHRGDDKAIDPVSLAALVVSFPSAVLAVQDLTDRIIKRRRARDLIDHAQQLAAQQVTVYLISEDRVVELRTLTPDQLLDLQPGEDPAC